MALHNPIFPYVFTKSSNCFDNGLKTEFPQCEKENSRKTFKYQNLLLGHLNDLFCLRYANVKYQNKLLEVSLFFKTRVEIIDKIF